MPASLHFKCRCCASEVLYIPRIWMLISAPSVYTNQPLSDGRRIWRACLISSCHFSSFTSAFHSFLPVAVSDVLAFLSRAFLVTLVPLSWTCTCVYGFTVVCYNPRPWARAENKAAPASPSPAFKQAFRGGCSGVITACEGWSWFRLLSSCRGAQDHWSCFSQCISIPFFPFFHTCSLNLCHLSSPGWMILGLCYKCSFWTKLFARRRWMRGRNPKQFSGATKMAEKHPLSDMLPGLVMFQRSDFYGLLHNWYNHGLKWPFCQGSQMLHLLVEL